MRTGTICKHRTSQKRVKAACCSQEEIDAAGAEPLINQASDRLSDICLEAAEILKAYRISPYQLVDLCVQHIGCETIARAIETSCGKWPRSGNC